MNKLVVCLTFLVEVWLTSGRRHDGVLIDLLSNKRHGNDNFQCKSTVLPANRAKILSVEQSRDIVLPLRVRLSPNLIENPHGFLKFRIGESFPR